MTKHYHRSDYGQIQVKILKVDRGDVLVELQEDKPPLGDKGNRSWVPANEVISGQ